MCEVCLERQRNEVQHARSFRQHASQKCKLSSDRAMSALVSVRPIIGHLHASNPGPAHFPPAIHA